MAEHKVWLCENYRGKVWLVGSSETSALTRNSAFLKAGLPHTYKDGIGDCTQYRSRLAESLAPTYAAAACIRICSTSPSSV